MLIDGKAIAAKIKEKAKHHCQNHHRKPRVVAIMLGENPAAESYLRMLERTCKSVDFEYTLSWFPDTLSDEALKAVIQTHNNDSNVDGIIVQMPLPPHISEEAIIMTIAPEKDLDGFHPMNAGRLFKGEKAKKPCTALAVVTILEELNIELSGKEVVVVGRSNIVGKPLAMMLLEKNATVTICHSKTQDLIKHTQRADVLIAAVGIPKFITKDMVSPKAIVIDVGMNEVEGFLIGDVDFEALEPYVHMITPVPGGVGPVTNAMLLLNLLEHYCEVDA